MTDPLLTAAARRYVARLLSAVAPHSAQLDRRFRTLLRKRGHDALQIRAFLAIAPAAASRLSTLGQFYEQVEYNGRRLAKLNVQPGPAKDALRAFGGLLDDVLPGEFEPAREQLYLATVLILDQAFYLVREAEAQAFFGLYRAELEAQGLDDLLRRLVSILTRAFHARTGRLLLLDSPLRGRLDRPLYIERDQTAEKLIADPEMRGQSASYWSFPLRPSALLQFGFDTRYPWLPRELTLLHAVAERCQEAIEKARMKDEIRRLGAESRRAEEEERRRIGRELHDEAGQSLLALRLKLELMERGASAEMLSQLAEARAITEHTVDELRRIIAALSPSVLERLGLVSAIRQLATGFRKMHAASIRVRVSGVWEHLSQRRQETIYRVAQESLQNIVKHSHATRVNLQLQSADQMIRLSVSDNGAGFVPKVAASKPAASKPMSFGLSGMRERVALLHGHLDIRSAPGRGVTVVLELPQDSA
jgi:signal transduction histidine kinase